MTSAKFSGFWTPSLPSLCRHHLSMAPNVAISCLQNFECCSYFRRSYFCHLTSSHLQGQCEDAYENWLKVTGATLEQL